MNCCNDYGDCNQGRDCPVRKERIERVAKVGKRMLGPDPLRNSNWRRQIRLFAEWMLLGIVGLLWLAFLAACVAYLS